MKQKHNKITMRDADDKNGIKKKKNNEDNDDYEVVQKTRKKKI